MNENISKKTNKGIIIILIILIVIVIGLSSYIVYDKVISSNSKTDIKDDIKDDKKPLEDNIEKVKISEEKMSEYEHDLNYLICSIIPLFSDIKYDINYIDNDTYKLKLVYNLLVIDKDIEPKVLEEGYRSAYLLSDFINKYYYIFSKNISKEEISRLLDDKMTIESDLIYGFPVSGIGDEYVKINSINYNKNTKVYNIDLNISDYNSNSNKVIKSKIEVVKNNDSYILKYLGFTK